VFMQLCIKLIIMEESTRKFSNQSSNWFKNVMACFQYIWVSTLLRLYFKGQKSLEPPRKIIKCWWCRTILRDIALTHWELGLKNCARTKQGIFYIIYQIAYVVNIQTSLRRGMFISRKRAASFCLISLLYLISTQNI
jgi:hypothetical protein